ncbi:MAG: hypothetical protein JWO64_965 [Hyphomicrobiales bacterium]|nr:hypothetical protein [Hyphomicrobiales bacterium]
MSAKSLAQCLEWAHKQPDPEGDIADAVIRLRRYEQAAALAYGDPAHEYLVTGKTDPEDARAWNQTWSSAWVASGADPADILGELHWVETLYERMARLDYGTPAHLNTMRYAEAHRSALFDKLGLSPMVRTEQE